jgi:peptidyl-prolyl cis-trans isomerase SurA
VLRLTAPFVLPLVLAAACGRQPSQPQSQSVSPDTWATVDGRPINRDDVEKAFRRTQEGTSSNLSPEEAMTIKLSLLNEMILQNILVAKAEALKIEVPASELDSAFGERKKNLTEEQFQQELKSRSLSPDDMRRSLREELLAKKLMEQEVTSKVSVSDQEVNDFYTANRAQFTIPEESYRVGQIVVTPDRAPQQINRTGNDATSPQEAAFKVRMIMERLKAGTSFAEIAADYSEDPETSSRGGDLGFVPVSALKRAPAALRDAVIGKPPGTVTVASSGGIHTIVVVIAHEQAGERTLSTPGVKDAITQNLKSRKEQLLRTAFLSAARGDAIVVNHVARRVVESKGKPQ